MKPILSEMERVVLLVADDAFTYIFRDNEGHLYLYRRYDTYQYLMYGEVWPKEYPYRLNGFDDNFKFIGIDEAYSIAWLLDREIRKKVEE